MEASDVSEEEFRLICSQDATLGGLELPQATALFEAMVKYMASKSRKTPGVALPQDPADGQNGPSGAEAATPLYKPRKARPGAENLMLNDNEDRPKAAKRTAEDDQASADERVDESTHHRQRVAQGTTKTEAASQLELVKTQQEELRKKSVELEKKASELQYSITTAQCLEGLDMLAGSSDLSITQ